MAGKAVNRERLPKEEGHWRYPRCVCRQGCQPARSSLEGACGQSKDELNNLHILVSLRLTSPLGTGAAPSKTAARLATACDRGSVSGVFAAHGSASRAASPKGLQPRGDSRPAFRLRLGPGRPARCACMNASASAQPDQQAAGETRSRAEPQATHSGWKACSRPHTRDVRASSHPSTEAASRKARQGGTVRNV